MISGGNATIIVADMDRSIRFYTDVLGMKLTNRFGNDWATVSASAQASRSASTRPRPNTRPRAPKAQSCWASTSTSRSIRQSRA